MHFIVNIKAEMYQMV